MFKNAHGFVLVYSVASQNTFNQLKKLRDEIVTLNENAKFVIVGNKIDLKSERQVSYEDASLFAEAYGYPFFESSALTRTNVDEPFLALINLIKTKQQQQQKQQKMKTHSKEAANNNNNNNNSIQIEQSQRFGNSKIVSLNVGGRFFDTTLSTLCKYPSSMLGTMFGGRMNSSTDSNGRYFIDRDGELFDIVLNWLRTESIKCDSKLLPNLLIEAEFYQLEALVDDINVQMQTDKQLDKADDLYLNTIKHWSSYAERSYQRYIPQMVEKVKSEIRDHLYGVGVFAISC